jgi:pilus assembly protein CpaB
VKRRLLAALAAILSTVLGAGLLLTYVAHADRRAMADMAPAQVLVTTKDVPAGTTGAALADLVEVKTLPSVALAPGAVQDLSGLAGLVTTSGLVPGEQVVSSRFADPATLAEAGRPAVPRGKQQITIDLEPQRVLGGDLVPGAHIAVFTTIEKRTRLVVRSALVMRVDPPPPSSEDAQPTAPVDGRIRVTLAMSAAEATGLVAGANSGAVWFSLVSGAPSTPPGVGTSPVKGVTS